MALTVPCAHCRGSGARDLTEIEEVTLNAVTSAWTTTADLRMRLRARGVELTAPAVVMRLQALHLFGLVDRKLATRGHYAWRLAR